MKAKTIRICALLVAVLLALSAVWTIAVSVGVPYLERRWTYRFIKETAHAPWQTPGGADKVAFLTSDGVRLRGWHFRGLVPRNGVTVLVLHGNFGVLADYVPNCRFLQRRGFDILLFNYRGFGMSDGRTEGEETLTLDAEAAMRFLTQVGIDPHFVAIAGISLGAPVAATLAARSPCRAVAVISPIASARHQARLEKPWLPEIILNNLGSPFDAAGAIAEARCPVAVVHGADDEVVPLVQAEQVFDAARPPKRLIVVPTAEHGLLNVSPENYLDDLAAFFLQGGLP